MSAAERDAVAKYVELCEGLASSLVAPGRRGRNGAEYDDLVQEGLIDVWQSLARGIRPSARTIRGRMLNYIRWLGRHSPTEYGTMLPLDDYESVTRGREEGERSAQNDDVLREVPGD